MFKRIIINSFFLIALITALFSCSHKVISNAPLVIYPAPPDTARIQYLTSYSSSLDISGKRSGLKSTVLGEDKGTPIGKPYGMATVRGKLFICDATIAGLEVIDLSKKTFTQFIPSGKGRLKLPLNCVTDAAGRLYVADGERKDVVVFDDKLNYVGAISSPSPQTDFRPLDVCVGAEKIWVTNSRGAAICEYNKNDLSFIRTFPDTTSGEKILYNPINITCGNGKIYVTDVGDFKIKIFNEAGTYTGSVGTYGKAPGQFVRPKGLALDKEDRLYVVDAGFENVQLFNNTGALLMYFGGPYKGPGDMWLPAKVLVDYENLSYYKKWVSPDYELSYLIFVSNQYGPDKISVYGAVQPARHR